MSGSRCLNTAIIQSKSYLHSVNLTASSDISQTIWQTLKRIVFMIFRVIILVIYF